MRDLKFEEVQEVNGGHGYGETAAAIVGFAFFGPVGAIGASLAFSAGYQFGEYIVNR